MRRTRIGLMVAGALAVLLALAPTVFSQGSTFSHETITFATTAIGFTATTLSRSDGRQAVECSGRLETAQIRELHDGETPTTTVGQPIEVGDIVILRGYNNLSRFKGIRTGGTSGVILFQCSAY